MPTQTEQDTGTAATIVAIQRFDAAFNRHDLAAVMACITDDCVFENTSPAPDGQRHEGREAVRTAFAEFFQSSPHAVFEIEELFASGDRGTVRWCYRWIEPGGHAGHVRGVDVMRVRDGHVAESFAYVKG